MLISFCIPTYNRCEYLRSTIESILNEIETSGNIDRVQICISDNNSTDGTEDMINELKAETKVQIVYSKNKINIGFDKNILKVASLSSAKYIWLFGSDDHIIEGSLVKMLDILDKEKSDVYLCNRVQCDINLKPIKYDWASNSLKTRFDSTFDSDLVEYFNSCTGLLGVFSFISSLVVNKEIWSQQKFDEKFNGFVYSHVFMILGMIVFNKSNISYIKDSLVFCRQNDDIIRNEGIVRRILLDITAYSEFAKYFFHGNKKIYNSFVRTIRKEHELNKFIFIKENIQKEQWRNDVFLRLKELNYNPLLLFLVDKSRIGSFIIRTLFFIKNKIILE
jgi:abequosyltransferase